MIKKSDLREYKYVGRDTGFTPPAWLNYQHTLPNLQKESWDSYVEKINVWWTLGILLGREEAKRKMEKK